MVTQVFSINASGDSVFFAAFAGAFDTFLVVDLAVAFAIVIGLVMINRKKVTGLNDLRQADEGQKFMQPNESQDTSRISLTDEVDRWCFSAGQDKSEMIALGKKMLSDRSKSMAMVARNG